MTEEREKVRCGRCELVQWRDGRDCRRCGASLPEPIVQIVERVVEKVVLRHDPQYLENLEQARKLIAAASDRLTQQCAEVLTPLVVMPAPKPNTFPTMAEMERALILAAYQRSNHKPVEAARVLGIGKTTLYRKLKEIGQPNGSNS